jgi:hypothetical protein
MAKIQQSLFSWQDVDGLGDLKRLQLVLSVLPDEGLMRRLEGERGKGRDDYPVRAVWNSLVAGVVFEHASVESLRRELMRNGQLRVLCGFDPVLGEDAVPSSSAYTRFLKRLLDCEELIQVLFDDLVSALCEALPDFGRVLAVDGKAIKTHGRPRGEDRLVLEEDGRRDLDANFGFKRRNKGTPYESVTKWFGYKLHLIVDAIHELPVAFEMTKASAAEQPQARKLLENLEDAQPELVAGCEYLLGDKGYEDTNLTREAWQEYGVKVVVPIKDAWANPAERKPVGGWANVFYTQEGDVLCCCPATATHQPMAYGGFEKTRSTHKWRCPAQWYDYACPGMSKCAVGGAIRIPLAEDPRVFTPLSRTHRDWAKLYAQRTSVERVNSRIDVSFGFERHFIRGWKKMWLRMGLALIVMLAMALGRIKEKQRDKLRSLVQAA